MEDVVEEWDGYVHVAANDRRDRLGDRWGKFDSMTTAFYAKYCKPWTLIENLFGDSRYVDEVGSRGSYLERC